MKRNLAIAIWIVTAFIVAIEIYCITQQPRLAFNPGNVGLLLQRGHIRYWTFAWRDGFKNGRAFYLVQDPPDSPLIYWHDGYRIIPRFTHRSYKPGCPPPATPWGPTK